MFEELASWPAGHETLSEYPDGALGCMYAALVNTRCDCTVLAMFGSNRGVMQCASWNVCYPEWVHQTCWQTSDTRVPASQGACSEDVWCCVVLRSVCWPQVVIIAAGFDTRAYRLGRPGVSFYEVDMPHASTKKQDLVRRLLPASKVCGMIMDSVC